MSPRSQEPAPSDKAVPEIAASPTIPSALHDVAVPQAVAARAAACGLPVLDASIALLRRRDGTVQIGWTPERRFVLRPPPGVDVASMIAVLRLIDGRRSLPDLYWRAAALGLDGSHLTVVLGELDGLGVLTRRRPERRRTPSVLVLGRGPLTDAVTIGLSPTCTVLRRHVTLPNRRLDVDCVVLCDSLTCRPEITAVLMSGAIAHLPVRVRDGTGVVGPFVEPGRTSCLQCADLTRCDYDREWPHLAAQMLSSSGAGPAPTVGATAAFAVAQVLAYIALRPDGPALPTFEHSVEIDATAATAVRRRWPPHALCRCRGE